MVLETLQKLHTSAVLVGTTQYPISFNQYHLPYSSVHTKHFLVRNKANKFQEPSILSMSASEMNANAIESAGIARVTFRVRCESLGYGEAVFLYPDDKSSPVSFCDCVVFFTIIFSS